MLHIHSVFLACCLLILLGASFIPYAAFKMNEALFATPYYQPNFQRLPNPPFHHDIALMCMSYVGTLKNTGLLADFPHIWRRSLGRPVPHGAGRR